MSFAIQYGGDECADCGQELRRGQQAAYVGEDHLVHVTCPVPPETCMTCFQQRAANGMCGCDE